MKLRLFFHIALLCCIFSPVTALAQCVFWLKPLAAMDGIERLGSHTFKLKDGGKVGIMDNGGNIVVPVEYDVIEPFYEDKALVVVNENGKDRVAGYMDRRNSFVKFSGKYYLLKGLRFYSEGMLPVSNANDQLGYLDANGKEHLFENGYTAIKPFTEGYATVYKGKNNYQLINHVGNRCRIVAGLARIMGGTNVVGGRAVVWDADGVMYDYRPGNNTCKKIAKPSSLSLDYLYCLNIYSGRGQQPKYQTLPTGAESLSPVSNGGKYGYASGGRTLIPAQFDSATPFVNNAAVVSRGGKWGLLGYSDTGSAASVKLEQGEYTYREGETVSCAFRLNVPSEWKTSRLAVTVLDPEAGDVVARCQADGDCRFSLSPKDGEHTFDFRVMDGDVLMWNGRQSCSFKKLVDAKPLTVSLKLQNERANADNHCIVTGTIYNPNEVEVTATIMMEGSGTFEKKSVTVTVPAGGRHTITSHFTVTKNLSGQKVTLSTSKGGSKTLDNMDLVPFYTGG